MKTNRKWKARYAVDAYRLAIKGCNNKMISKGLDITENTFLSWYRTHRLFSYAVDHARSDRIKNGTQDLQTYILKHMGADARKVWDQINKWNDSENKEEWVDALLANQSKQVRQSLWLQAFIACGLNASRACRLVNVSQPTIDQWKRDPDFIGLLDEFREIRKDFLEQSLMDLVAHGSVPAIIFANSTVNRDRGYGKKPLDERIEKNDGIYALEDLDLPIPIRRVILEAMTKRESELAQDTADSAS